jgi:hypothetical protein
MRYVVVVFLDTERTPRTIVNEVVSNLDFDNQEVVSATILTDDGLQVAVYDARSRHESQGHAER